MKKLNDIPIVFYDGSCALCHRAVNFLHKLDKKQKLHYAPIGGKTYIELGLHNLKLPESLVFHYQGRIFLKSRALLAITTLLPRPYRMFACLKIIPANILDRFYDFLAQNRYRFFKEKEICPISVNKKPLFLD